MTYRYLCISLFVFAGLAMKCTAQVEFCSKLRNAEGKLATTVILSEDQIECFLIHIRGNDSIDFEFPLPIPRRNSAARGDSYSVFFGDGYQVKMILTHEVGIDTYWARFKIAIADLVTVRGMEVRRIDSIEESTHITSSESNIMNAFFSCAIAG